jgi:hypothetical protein
MLVHFDVASAPPNCPFEPSSMRPAKPPCTFARLSGHLANEGDNALTGVRRCQP